MTDTEDTKRQILDRLVEKLQAEHDTLSKTRRALEEEITRKRKQLADLTDMIAAEELRVQEAKELAERTVQETTRSLESATAQAKSKATEAIAQCKKEEEQSIRRKDNALQAERDSMALAEIASAKSKSAQAQLAQVVEAMQRVLELVAQWKA